MNINEVKNFTKVADIILDKYSKKFFNVEWIIEHKKFCQNVVDRIYIITENDIIKKIGGSACKGGLQKTILTYRDSSKGGKPSIRTTGVPLLINNSLKNGNKIAIYGMLGEKSMQKIKGLFEEKYMFVTANYKHSEMECLSDYKKICKKFPEWNFQENNEEWPEHIIEEHKKITLKKKFNLDENTD